MDIKELQTKERRSRTISIRTFPSYSKWLAEREVSPSLLFNKAVEELMELEHIKNYNETKN